MKKNNLNIYLATILVLLILMVSFIRISESSFFKITDIEVSGDNNILKKDIIDKLNGFIDTPIIFVNTSRIEEEILKDARVLNVRVYKKLPTTIKVDINERKIAAFIKLDKFYAVDENLNIFSYFNEIGDKNFPIIQKPENDEDKRVITKILKQLIVSDIFKISSEIIKYEDYYAIILSDGTRIFVDEDITKNKLNQSYVVYKKEMKLNKDRGIEYIELRFNSIIVK